MAIVVTAKERYLAAFETLEREGALSGPSWLASRRRSAMARFAEAGFPTTRDEAWRYTSLAPLTAMSFGPAARARDRRPGRGRRSRLPGPVGPAWCS